MVAAAGILVALFLLGVIGRHVQVEVESAEAARGAVMRKPAPDPHPSSKKRRAVVVTRWTSNGWTCVDRAGVILCWRPATAAEIAEVVP